MDVTFGVFEIDVDVDDVWEVDMIIYLRKVNVVEHTFYMIEFIKSFLDSYCIIGCGGCDFIVDERYEVVKHKIHENMIYRYN